MFHKPTWRIIAGVVLLAACIGLVSQVAHHAEPFPDRVTLAEAESVTPLTLFGGRPIVPVTINGKGPFRFILDTGAAMTVVSQPLATQLQLPTLRKIMMGRPGGTNPVPALIMRVENLSVGNARLDGLKVVSSELGPLFTKLSNGEELPQGILCATAFKGLLVVIDYPHESVQFKRGTLPAADDATVFAWTGDLPSVTALISSRAVRMHLDTGSGGAFSIPAEIEKDLTFASVPVPVEPGRTVEGEVPRREAILKGVLSVGNYRFQNPTLQITTGVPAGNIGSKILKDFTVTVDSTNRRLRLERAAETGREGESGTVR